MGIPKFESYVVGHPVRSLEIFPTMSRGSPPFASFLREAECLCVPNLKIHRRTVPKISARLRQYPRFLENRAGDWARSHCVTGCQLSKLGRQCADSKHVRSFPKSGLSSQHAACALCAKNGLIQCSKVWKLPMGYPLRRGRTEVDWSAMPRRRSPAPGNLRISKDCPNWGYILLNLA